MHNFRHILFVSHGLEDESDGLQQALSVARACSATLKVFAVCPRLPKDLREYGQVYEKGLVSAVQQSLASACEKLGLDANQLSVEIEVNCGSTPAERIIQQVLGDGFDMVVKSVEGKERLKGFMAMDMELLRKCPCPVWLSRPSKHANREARVLVAIDPECENSDAYDLAIRLLRLSRALADDGSGTLHIVSCWDYDVDAYLRHRFPIGISDEELDKAVEAAGSRHRAKLDVLIKASGIGGDLEIHHTIARPDRFIPLLVDERHFDLLVMGTVARTGIPGFIMGNTAENILQKVSCSLLALKPVSFVSPVGHE
ncbi:universal stress protein [Microbulbifer sp. TYP-18]|uniref:universal stress protein n=1 Tax=Microbulbifer sp. TYP-18 TaxID=3230024 RepID=UPI0034C621AA